MGNFISFIAFSYYIRNFSIKFNIKVYEVIFYKQYMKFKVVVPKKRSLEKKYFHNFKTPNDIINRAM